MSLAFVSLEVQIKNWTCTSPQFNMAKNIEIRNMKLLRGWGVRKIFLEQFLHLRELNFLSVADKNWNWNCPQFNIAKNIEIKRR